MGKVVASLTMYRRRLLLFSYKGATGVNLGAPFFSKSWIAVYMIPTALIAHDGSQSQRKKVGSPGAMTSGKRHTEEISRSTPRQMERCKMLQRHPVAGVISYTDLVTHLAAHGFKEQMLQHNLAKSEFGRKFSSTT